MLKKSLSLTCLTLLIACGQSPSVTIPIPSPTITPPLITPSAEPSAISASISPTLAPTSVPTSIPTVEPTAVPTSTPTEAPTAIPTAPPTVIPTATPFPLTTATATSDISVVEKTTLNGMVFDDAHLPLEGVTVTAKSLNSTVSFNERTTTVGGAYHFNHAPAGIMLEITASRPGYTTRQLLKSARPNKTDDPNINRYDFGTNGSSSSFGLDYNAISDKPEVIAVTPERNATGVYPNSGPDPESSFVLKLKFSEPMDRDTVLHNLSLSSFKPQNLTVDTSGASTMTGSTDVNTVTGTLIWDRSAFKAIWNGDQTEVTLSFKDGYALPTDRNPAKTPEYQVSLDHDDGWVKDVSGVTRGTGEKKFKLTDDDFEASYKFSVRPDDTSPAITSAQARTAETGSSDGDSIRVRYSEPMAWFTLGATIAGGMGGDASQAAAGFGTLSGGEVGKNYRVTVSRNGARILDDANWGSQIGGRVIFDSTDPTHQTVILLPPTSEEDLFKPGDDITVNVASVVDPAGNPVTTSGNTALTVAQ